MDAAAGLSGAAPAAESASPSLPEQARGAIPPGQNNEFSDDTSRIAGMECR